MSMYWWRAWVILRAGVVLSLGIFIIVVAFGMFWASEHQPPKWQHDHQLFMADSIKVSALVDSNDVEPDSVEIYHLNRVFAGATVTFSTLAGSVTKRFDAQVVRDEDGDVEEQAMCFPNPGYMRSGWKLHVVYGSGVGRQVEFRSQRTGQKSELSVHLYISAAGRGPRLYLNWVEDPRGREMILLPAVGFQLSQAIAAI
jgi:hypothetical protein